MPGIHLENTKPGTSQVARDLEVQKKILSRLHSRTSVEWTSRYGAVQEREHGAIEPVWRGEDAPSPGRTNPIEFVDHAPRLEHVLEALAGNDDIESPLGKSSR